MFQSFEGLSGWNVTAAADLKSKQDVQSSHTSWYICFRNPKFVLSCSKVIRTVCVWLNHDAAVSLTQNTRHHLHSVKIHLNTESFIVMHKDTKISVHWQSCCCSEKSFGVFYDVPFFFYISNNYVLNHWHVLSEYVYHYYLISSLICFLLLSAIFCEFPLCYCMLVNFHSFAKHHHK